MKETRFKETEIGYLPIDWEVIPLNKIGSFSKGRGISRAESNTGSIPAVRYGEIYTVHNDYIKKFYSFINDEIAKSSCSLKYGDILFTASGETKEDIAKAVAFIHDGTKAYAGGDIIILSPKIKVSSKFLGYILNTQSVISQRASKAQGDAVVHITTNSIASIKVALPSYTEQKRIADTLSEIDTLISEVGKLIEKKKAIKHGAMQELLTGKKRLKGFTKPWTKIKLCKVLKYEQPTEYLVSSSEYYNNGTPVLTAGKTFILGYTHDTWGVYNNLPVIIFDDFVTESKYVDFPFKVKSSAMKMLSLRDNKNDLRFVYSLMQTIDFPMTDHKRYWIKEYSQIEVFLPEPEEQKTISKIISNMDNEISYLDSKLSKYIAIKQGMMQQLLSGKIRLK